MTKQEIYDKVFKHFIVDRNPLSFSAEPSFRCMYRGPNGAKCAAGVLIPDEEYEDYMEGKSFRSLYEYQGDNVTGELLRQHGEFVEDLQVAHDDVARYGPEDARFSSLHQKFIEIAKYHGLNPRNEWVNHGS